MAMRMSNVLHIIAFLFRKQASKTYTRAEFKALQWTDASSASI
jgi:hypothetical protein